MKPPMLLLFDVDGTLVRTNGAGVRALNRGFFEVMGWENALATFSPAGMTDMAIAHRVSRWFRGDEMTPEEMKRVFERYLEVLPEELERSEGFRVLPGIKPFLEKHSRDGKFLIGLGTGNLEQGASIKLRHAGLHAFFRYGGYGSDALDRAQVIGVARQRGEELAGMPVPPERVVVIGDTPMDIQAGRAIGARTLAVATGPFRVPELEVFKPDLALADFNDPGVVESTLEAWQ